MLSRWPPQRSEDQTSRGHLSKPITNSVGRRVECPRDGFHSHKAEDMMPVRKPPQRSEDQLPNGAYAGAAEIAYGI